MTTPKDLSPITIQATVNAPMEKVWTLWNDPEQVKQWNNASPDWHTPQAENDLRTGGRFNYLMAAKDGSFSFNFEGTYSEIKINALIAYELADGRHVKVVFTQNGSSVSIVETFDPESMNSRDMQQAGWQAILDNFKKHAEAN